MSIFSKGHDAKNFLGIKCCSTGKKASENTESGWVYRRWYTYCILNKCELLVFYEVKNSALLAYLVCPVTVHI